VNLLLPLTLPRAQQLDSRQLKPSGVDPERGEELSAQSITAMTQANTLLVQEGAWKRSVGAVLPEEAALHLPLT
jgi:hypothetical protein